MFNRKFFLAIAAIAAISGLLLVFVPDVGATVSGGSVTGNAAADLVVGAANADYNVSFDTSATSTAATITITFPTGYTITDGLIGTPTTAICNSGCSVNGVISIGGIDRAVDNVVGNSSARTIVVTLSGSYDLSTGAGVAFRLLLGITNRTVSGVTGTFSITSNASGEEAQTNVAGVTLTPGAATVLVYTTPPSGSVSGIALTGQPVITARDQYGNTDTNFTEVITLTEASAGTLTNATTSAASGVATFSDLIYTASVDQESFTLTADDEAGVGTDLSSVNADPVTSDVVATKILVTTAPASVVSGVSMTQPEVKYVDAQDTVDTAIGATDTVEVTVTTGSLAGTQTVSASSGVVTFTDLVYTATADHATTTFTFTDNALGDKNFSGAPVSSTNVDPNVLATILVYTVQPSGSVSGIALTGQPVLESRDAGGLKDTDYVTNVLLTVATGPGALTGTTTLAPVAGVVTYTDIIYTATADQEAFTILAASGSLTSATSSSVTSDVVATKLIFSTQPAHAGTPNGDVISGTVFATQPIVSAVDAQDTVDTGYTSTVTLSKVTGAGSVAGTLMKAAVSGVADFSGQGVKYTATADQQTFSLAADQGVLTQGVSNTLTADVVATVIVVTTQPDDAAATNGDVRNGIVFATQPAITYRDAAGITDTNVVDPITVSLTVGAGTLGGTTTKTAVSGVATFTDLLYTLEAGESDQQSITLSFVDDATGTVDLSASPVTDASTVDVVATQVVIQTQPASIISGVSMTQPVVRYLDAQNKVDTNVTDTLTATEGGAGSLAGTAAKAAVSGVVTYTDLIYTAITDQESVTFTFTDDVAGIDLSAPPIDSNALVANVVATKIIVSTQPSGSVSGIALTGQPIIYFTDANDTLDTAANTDQVTASVFSGGGTLSGTTAISASNGVVTFTNLAYTATADQEAFVLRFTDDAGGTNAFNGSPANATSTVSDVVATKFLVTLVTNTPTAGAADTMTLTAANAQDTTDTGYDPTGLTFSFLDSGANALSTHTSPNSTSPTIPTSTVVIAAFSSGEASLTTFTLVEAEVLGAITVNDGTLSGTSVSVTVRHATTASYTVSSSTATPTAGTAFNLTVTAKDAYGNTANGANGATAYTGTVFFSTTAASPTWHTPWTSFVSGDVGVKTVTNAVTLNTVESGVSITAQTVDGTITGTVGSLNVSASADTTAPVITDIQVSSITNSGATITWTTNESASSTVEYGTTPSFGSSTASSTMVTSHSVALTGLSGSTTYYFRVKSSDAAANTQTSVTNTFLTSGSDTTGPTVSSQTPVNGATSIAITTAPYIDFSEELKVSSITTSTVQLLKSSDDSVATSTVSLANGGARVIVTPASSLANSTSYYLYASTGVQDAAGNALAVAYGSSSTSAFTTVATGDTTGPTVSSQTPLDNATSTAVTVSPVLTFNEALDASTVNGATVQLRNYSDNAAVSATVSYNSASTTVTIDPIASLANSTQYYLYAVGVKDSAGNALTTDYSATTKATHEFTTVADSSDTTGPTVSSQTPLDNATSTAVTVSPTITFSEAMDANTVNTNTVQLRLYSDDSIIASTYSMNDARTIVTIDPVASLLNSTQYYLWASGAKDAAGNTMTAYSTKASQEFTTTAESVTLAVTQISASRTYATADNTYANGWSWVFSVTAPTSETSLTMKFADWISGSNSIAAASNIRFYSAQSSNATSSSPITITAANTYSSAMTLNADLDANTAGRQIQVTVEVKVPTGSAGGSYSTSYGIQSQ